MRNERRCLPSHLRPCLQRFDHLFECDDLRESTTHRHRPATAQHPSSAHVAFSTSHRSSRKSEDLSSKRNPPEARRRPVPRRNSRRARSAAPDRQNWEWRGSSPSKDARRGYSSATGSRSNVTRSAGGTWNFSMKYLPTRVSSAALADLRSTCHLHRVFTRSIGDGAGPTSVTSPGVWVRSSRIQSAPLVANAAVARSFVPLKTIFASRTF